MFTQLVDRVKSFFGGKGLPVFGAEIGKQPNPVSGMPDIRLPYQDVLSFFGYVKPGAAPDETRDGKKFFYLYLWVPVVAPELGVRMISPVGGLAAPKNGDFTAPEWPEAQNDATNYFDTWICVERASSILNPSDIAAKAKTAEWTNYGSNDDSSELPAQPSGRKYNSLLRVVSDPGNPMKAIVRGLYRIGFTSFKPGEVQGSFMAQVGAPIKLPGTVIARDVAGLVKTLEENEKKAEAKKA